MRREPREHRFQIMSGAPATAGWVLADMLLVLMIIAFGVQVTSAAPPQPEEPPVQRQKERERQRPAMQQRPVKLMIRLGADALVSGSRGMKTLVRRQISRQTRTLRGRTAALVFVWGRAPEVGRGLAIANAVQQQVRPANPRLFGRALIRPYWSGGREGTVELEIYVFS